MAASKCSAVDLFLDKLNLKKYRDNFYKQGFERATDLFLLGENDFDLLNIVFAEDRAKILSSAKDIDIQWWLDDIELGCYTTAFRKEGVNALSDVQNPELVDALITMTQKMLPGHRKRFQREASFLRCQEPEEIEVIGCWGQPTEMTENKYPFLIVPGFLKSGKGEGALSSELIHFTVDSGSEVCVTAYDHLIDTLKLEHIQNIESRGVHTAAKKPLYKAVLRLGKSEITVEVMPDRFCTVGIPVMRKFSHHIDGESHRWLKDR